MSYIGFDDVLNDTLFSTATNIENNNRIVFDFEVLPNDNYLINISFCVCSNAPEDSLAK